MDTTTQDNFLQRNEFLLRRLHSLSGLIPVGAYMCVHLLTNATVLDSPATFQKNVYSIHGLGKLLPLVEWGFIFLPILFHGIFGFVIIRGGLSNSSTYSYGNNVRYTLQRVSGMIAFFFIMWHVFPHARMVPRRRVGEKRCLAAFGSPIPALQRRLDGGRSDPGIDFGANPLHGRHPLLRIPFGQWNLDNGHYLGRLDDTQGPATRHCSLRRFWGGVGVCGHERTRWDANRWMLRGGTASGRQDVRVACRGR